jgi:hypothetical protein
MITRRIPQHLFAALRSGFEAGASDDAPLDSDLLDKVRRTLIEANATSTPGLPIILTLESEAELQAVSTCFEVGGETNPNVSDDQWLSILSLLEQASEST